MKFFFVILFILATLANTKFCIAQNVTDSSLLADNVKSYISDGQDHIIFLKKNTSTKINAIFYPKFNYKIAVEPENKNLLVEINLLDQYGNIQFTNTNKKYTKEWNFTFQSVMPLIIELKIKNNIDKKEEQVHLAISHVLTDD